MSIDNQTALFTAAGIGAEFLQAQLPGKEVVTGGPEGFLQRLTEQLSELSNNGSLQVEVEVEVEVDVDVDVDVGGLDRLTTVSEERELNPKTGNFLPPVAISDPEASFAEDLPDPVQQTPVISGLGSVEGKIIQPNPVKDNSTDPTILQTRPERIIPKLETSGNLVAVDDLNIEVDAVEPNEVVSKQVLNSVNAFVQNTQPARQTLISVERPVGQSGWNQELGNRIIWMTGKSVDVAQIRVNPPQLGPLEVRINVNQDQVSVAFSAQNAVVREALEAAVPRLREMFGGQQLNLVNVDISQQSFSEHHRHEFSDEGRNAEQGDGIPHLQSADETSVDSIEDEINSVTSGLVSYYV